MRNIVQIMFFGVGLAFIFYDRVPFLDIWPYNKQQIKQNHKRSLGPTEHYRIQALLENIKIIEKHNKIYEKGESSFKMKINPFADMTLREFAKKMNGYKKIVGKRTLVASTFMIPVGVIIPKYIDWREKGGVTEPKNQGSCGACWAFSATGAIETQEFRKSGNLVSLSEQNLIDCSVEYGNQGCNGGQMEAAFEYVKNNKGLNTESEYPYLGEDGQSCRYKKNDGQVQVTGYVRIKEGNETQLMEAVATVGPVSVAMDASHSSFQFYAEGIYYEPKCSSRSLNHAVLVIGYGTSTAGEDYWIIKNSWGIKWGDKGYAKLARNKRNNCGVATTSSYPLM